MMLLVMLLVLLNEITVVGKADDPVSADVGQAVAWEHPLSEFLVTGRDSILKWLHAECAVLIVGIGRHALDGGGGEVGELMEAVLAAEGVQVTVMVVLARGRDEGHRLGRVLEVGLAVVVLGVLEQELDGHRGPVEGVVGWEVGLVNLRGCG